MERLLRSPLAGARRKLAFLLTPLLLVVGFGVAASGGATVHAAKAVPPSPPLHVLDEPEALSPAARGGVARLLAEHERVTGEQVVIAIFRSLDGEDPVDFTNRSFEAWKIGQRAKNNGVLLALYWQDRKIRIEVGYGLEPLLTDAKSRQIIDESLAPALKDGNPDAAVRAAALQILATLESPLLANNQAQALLGAARDEIRRGSRGPESLPRGRLLNLIILFGIIFLIRTLDRLRNPETLYTARGWSRANRGPGLPHHPGHGGIFGGGLRGGGGFGGGGFGGGGGRSGGGGASGGW
jgi:uncharacterized protein